MRVSAIAVSLCAVLFAVIYVVAPASGAFAFKVRSAGYAPAGTVVLYGTVKTSSGPISAADVTVVGDSNGHWHNRGLRIGQVVGSVRTDPQGTYRLQLFLIPGLYTVNIAVPNSGYHRDFQFQVSNSQAGNSGANQTSTAGSGIANSGVGNSGYSGRDNDGHGHNGWSDNGGNHTTAYRTGDDRDGPSNFAGHSRFGRSPGNRFSSISGSQVLTLTPGVSYDVSAVLTTSNFLSFLPVSSY